MLTERKHHVLGPTVADVFEVRSAAGAHLVSVGVGLVALIVAVVMPASPAPLSGFAYFLMGPGHWIYAVRARKKRPAMISSAGAGLSG